MFQLAARGGSGNVLDPQSLAYGTVNVGWLQLDEWFPRAGVVAILPALFVRKLRGPAIMLGIQIAMFFRTSGYIPFPMIIMLTPFMALLVVGLMEAVWPTRRALQQKYWPRRALAVVGVLLVFAVPAGFVVAGGADDWKATYAYESGAQQIEPQREVVQWARQHLKSTDTVVVESEIWLDLVQNVGLPQKHVVMTYKLDTDPDVRATIGDPDVSVTYVIVKRDTLKPDERSKGYPTVLKLAKKAKVVASFGTAGDDNEWLMFQLPH